MEEKSQAQKFRKIRASTGMNRREFSDWLKIPYPTMYDWEAGNRKMPEYVIELIDFKVQAIFGKEQNLENERPTSRKEIGNSEQPKESVRKKLQQCEKAVEKNSLSHSKPNQQIVR